MSKIITRTRRSNKNIFSSNRSLLTDIEMQYPAIYSNGFQIEFDNGYRVSILVGEFAYSVHGSYNKTAPEIETDLIVFEDCEIAIYDNKKEWATRKWRRDIGDDVIGYCTAKDILLALKWAERQKPVE